MNVEIAQRLAEMRREKGYSQEELATQLGLSRQAVSKWERAESSPDTGNLIALADLYGITLDELVRVEVDIVDDIQFEVKDKSVSAEVQVQEAQVAAAEARVAAAAASAAAVQAKVAAQTASAETASRATARTEESHTSSQPAAQARVFPAQDSYQGAPQTPPPYAQGSSSSAPQAPGVPASATPVSPPPPQGYSVEQAPRKKGPWITFPYPILCVVVFLLSGFFWGIWHPSWIVFLTIPLYYWIANIIENDPNYRNDHR